MDEEIIDTENWIGYGYYRVYPVVNKYGNFYKVVLADDDPECPADICSYARSWRRAVAFLMRQEADALIEEENERTQDNL